MPRFAVYYVPELDSDIYTLGSQVLQHDVRRATLVETSPYVRQVLGGFDDAWIALSRPYGFHLTVGDAMDCTWSAVPAVEHELDSLLQCFDSGHPFTLHWRQEDRIVALERWDKKSLVLRYDANDYLKMLHALIVARINPLGTGSAYLRRYLSHQDELAPHAVQQTRLFNSPTVLDNWAPHFTLLDPYKLDNVDEMVDRIAHLFVAASNLEVTSLCLMIQPDEDNLWQIYREFPRGISEAAGRSRR
jgi:hypothetical protein